MNHLELILPFSIPPAGLAKDLSREIRTPALARLIACASRAKLQATDEFSHALAHEYWLAGDFPPSDTTNSPANAGEVMQQAGLTVGSGYWFTIKPVHIHIARDHLVLTDQRRLSITDTESRVLFDIAQTCCQEVGLTLLYGDAKTWFLRADDWMDLHTATADAACGHNIDIWMPAGKHERDWRKLQNEIQMIWFTHNFNAEREMRGEKVINSIWISNGGSFTGNNSKALHKAAGVTQYLDAIPAGKHTVLADQLCEAAINNDWGQWLDEMQRLEENWFAPLLHAVQAKKISHLQFICSDARTIAQFDLTPWSLRKFWIKNSLNNLFSIAKP
ncbi:hypothetical protein [Undibacterium sp. TJN19]|uniref:hypothetical protein n=1 Tax=Undibacterium sp. TJN19 TaxID=3413055 RepID=UPI003BF0CD3A